MLIATFAEVDDSDLPRLREWLDALDERREELRSSYRTQGTRHELFFLVSGATVSLLVLISEVENVESASLSFLRSNLPIDIEFKQLVRSIAREAGRVELLYDSAHFVGTPS